MMMMMSHRNKYMVIMSHKRKYMIVMMNHGDEIHDNVDKSSMILLMKLVLHILFVAHLINSSTNTFYVFLCLSWLIFYNIRLVSPFHIICWFAPLISFIIFFCNDFYECPCKQQPLSIPENLFAALTMVLSTLLRNHTFTMHYF